MARKLFEFRATRARAGGLAVGIEYVVWDNEAATVLADISTSSGGSSIAGSTVTTADIAGLGPSACRFWGPTDDQDTLWVTCPSDPTLGVQRVEASTDARLDALEAGSASGIPGSIFDAKGDLIAATAADTAARLPVGGVGTELVPDTAATSGLKWVAQPFINAKHPPYNAVGNGVADDTAALQAAISAAAGGTCLIPRGLYGISATLVAEGRTRIVGVLASPNIETSYGTTITPLAGFNGDLLTHNNIGGVSDNWAHGLQVEHISFLARAGQSAGSGIKMRMGELSAIRSCNFRGFPEAGIRLFGEHAPGTLDANLFNSNQWGVWVEDSAGSIQINGASGDDNNSLVRVSNTTAGAGVGTGWSVNVVILNVKAEVGANGKHDPLISCSNLNEGSVSLIGGSVSDYSTGSPASPANKAVVKITGTTGKVLMSSLYVVNYPRLIDDTVTGDVFIPPNGALFDRAGIVAHRYQHAFSSELYIQRAAGGLAWLKFANSLDPTSRITQIAVDTNGDTYLDWSAQGTAGDMIWRSGTGFAERMRLTNAGQLVLGASGPRLIQGAGTPEAAVTAAIGSVFLRTDGAAGTTLYLKETGAGNTGWVAQGPNAKTSATNTFTGDQKFLADVRINNNSVGWLKFMSVAETLGGSIAVNQGNGAMFVDFDSFNGAGDLVFRAGSGTAERARLMTGGGFALGGSTGPQIRSGAGTPEAVVTAPIGSIFLRSDGGAGTSLYVKQSGAGNTGWAAVTP